MTKAKKELFKIMDTPFGRKSVFVGGIEDMVHNLTMEGLESGFGKAPAKAAEGSTDKPGEAPK